MSGVQSSHGVLKEGKQMKKILSKQRNQKFSYCPHPVTIDKSADWGPGNFQNFPDGVFLKHANNDIITHGVQPTVDRSRPVGWIPSDLEGVGWIGETEWLFDKMPIWVEEETVLCENDVITLDTLDGKIMYTCKGPSFCCYNDLDGKPNFNDSWVQLIKDIEKNYFFELTTANPSV
jgi:hypothetical protein